MKQTLDHCVERILEIELARGEAPTVATPIAWNEVKPGLDPSAFTIHTVPERLKRMKNDPWKGFSTVDQTLPDTTPSGPAVPKPGGEPTTGKSAIVVARKPTPRR